MILIMFGQNIVEIWLIDKHLKRYEKSFHKWGKKKNQPRNASYNVKCIRIDPVTSSDTRYITYFNQIKHFGSTVTLNTPMLRGVLNYQVVISEMYPFLKCFSVLCRQHTVVTEGKFNQVKLRRVTGLTMSHSLSGNGCIAQLCCLLTKRTENLTEYF